MRNLLRSEWIKFSSVRSTVVTLALAGILVVLVAVLAANDARGNTTVSCERAGTVTSDMVSAQADPACGEGSVLVTRRAALNLTGLTGGVTFATLIFGVLGVQVIGQEYRFNTIRPTFTAVPRRMRVLGAKLAVVTAACAVVAVAMVALCWVVGSLMVDGFTVDGTDRRLAAWGIVVFTVLWTTAGMGVGAIVRQPIAGIMIIVAESLIVESLLGAIVESTLPWLPFTNGVQMTLRNDGGAPEQLRPLLEGGIYFALICAAVWAIGAYLVNRRDA